MLGTRQHLQPTRQVLALDSDCGGLAAVHRINKVNQRQPGSASSWMGVRGWVQ